MRRILLIVGILVGLTGLACSEGKLPTSAGNYGSISGGGTDTDSERNTGSINNGEGWVTSGDSTWPAM